MPIYISRGRFTSDAVKGMVAKPENREEAVAKLFESVGGRLIGWYLTFGPRDWLVIGEFPDNKAAASAILAAAAGGSLSDIETTPAMTAKDAHAAFESATKAAKAFPSAGPPYVRGKALAKGKDRRSPQQADWMTSGCRVRTPSGNHGCVSNRSQIIE